MRIRIRYGKYFRTVCTTLLSLLYLGCTNDKLDEFNPGNTSGKTVMVSLNVSLPAVEPTFASGYTATK